MKKISVIMPVFNNSKFLRGCLDCLFAQTYKEWELIVVNDASTEPVQAILDEYSDKYPDKIKVYVNQKNIGLTKSLNICLDMADGDLFARQDSDDISLPSRFEKQVEVFKEKGVGLSSTWGRTVNLNYPEVSGRRGDVYLDKEIRGSDEKIMKKLWKMNCIAGPAAMFSREVFEKIGYYDESLYYSQDYNYWLRIIQFFNIRIVHEDLWMRRLNPKSVRSNTKLEHLKENLFERVTGNAKNNPIIKERNVEV